MNPAGTNWAGNLTYSAARYEEPSSLAELAELITGTPKLRVVGSRHSFNDIADTEALLVGLRQLPGDPEQITLDPEAMTVRVPGQLRYGDLARVLADAGFAVANLASLPHISIAGAVATGTHGSGDAIGSLATQVLGLEILDGRGRQRTLTVGQSGFAGAVVSLGALGAVTHLTLRIEPAFDVAQTVFEGGTWDHILNHYDQVTAAGDSVSIFTTWQDPDLVDQVWVKKRMDSVPHPELEAPFVAAAAQRHPIPGIDGSTATGQLGVPGPWYDRLPHFGLDFTPSAGDEIQSEYLVPRADAVRAIRAVRGIADRIAPVLQVSEIRSMTGDDLWLSPAFGTDTVGLHFTWVKDAAAVERVLPVLEAVLPDTARPHWGKVFADHDRVASLYPRWDDFRVLMRDFDPGRRFVNRFLERLGLG